MNNPFGAFLEEALEAYQNALAGKEGADFAEGDSYDFTRCVRPDGSFYGTNGRCRKGTLTGAKEQIKKEVAKRKTETPKPSKPKKAEVEMTTEGLTKAPDGTRITTANGTEYEKKDGKFFWKKPSGELGKSGYKPNEMAEEIQFQKNLKGQKDEVVEVPKERPLQAKKPETAPKPTEIREVDPTNPRDYHEIDSRYNDLIKKSLELKYKGDIEGAEAIKASKEYKKLAEDYNKAWYVRKAITEKQDELQRETKLTPTQQKAIKDYTRQRASAQNPSRGYSQLNGCLRSLPSCKDKEASDAFAKELDSALAALPKNESGSPFYRGMKVGSPETRALYRRLLNAEPGTSIKDPGFGSYSSEDGIAKNFAGMYNRSPGILFVSNSKAMTPMNVFSELPHEREALIPRDTEQTIRRVTKVGNTLVVELD
jgi:hypothetical protein